MMDFTPVKNFGSLLGRINKSININNKYYEKATFLGIDIRVIKTFRKYGFRKKVINFSIPIPSIFRKGI